MVLLKTLKWYNFPLITMGPVESFLKKELESKKALLFVLVDSEDSDEAETAQLAVAAEQAGASLILVGGSSATNQFEMAQVVKSIKASVQIPVVLFPGNITGVVPGADAILFSSLLNSENPYYISQAQALGASNILKFGLEPLPTAYLVIGDGTSAWFVGFVRGIPFDKPKIAAAYSLAARFFGMRFVYLEAGSGSKRTVLPDMVAAVRKSFDGFLIVGGGICNENTARELVEAGADALVIGTFFEKKENRDKLSQISRAVTSD